MGDGAAEDFYEVVCVGLYFPLWACVNVSDEGRVHSGECLMERDLDRQELMDADIHDRLNSKVRDRDVAVNDLVVDLSDGVWLFSTLPSCFLPRMLTALRLSFAGHSHSSPRTPL